jgi:hypothetical protein
VGGSGGEQREQQCSEIVRGRAAAVSGCWPGREGRSKDPQRRAGGMPACPRPPAPSPPPAPAPVPLHLVSLQVVQAKQEVHALLVQHRDGAGQEVGTHLDLGQVDAPCRRRQQRLERREVHLSQGGA